MQCYYANVIDSLFHYVKFLMLIIQFSRRFDTRDENAITLHVLAKMDKLLDAQGESFENMTR
jgi:hypothetical protein